MENKANYVLQINFSNLFHTLRKNLNSRKEKKNLEKCSLDILELSSFAFRQNAKHALILYHSESYMIATFVIKFKS